MQAPRLISRPAVRSLRRPVDALRRVALYAVSPHLRQMRAIARNPLSQKDPIENPGSLTLPGGAPFACGNGLTLRLLARRRAASLPHYRNGYEQLC